VIYITKVTKLFFPRIQQNMSENRLLIGLLVNQYIH